MKILLDTHTFIWWDSDLTKLSKKARQLCGDSSNKLMLSVASVWEMQIKLNLGKLKLKLPLNELIEIQQETNNLEVLPIQLEHALAVGELPTIHKDPFDRLLIAQANAEGALLVSRDKVFSQYQVNVLW